jgi:hypothetical protein
MRRLTLPASLIACLAVTLLAAAPVAGASGGVVPQRGGDGRTRRGSRWAGWGNAGHVDELPADGHDPLFNRE